MTTWTDVIGWTLVHFLWEGTAIAAAAAMALRTMRGASARMRYATACCALVASLAAPVATAVVLLIDDSLAMTPPSPLVQVPLAANVAATAPAVAGTWPTFAGGSLPLVTAQQVGTALSVFVVCWASGVLLLTIRLASGWWRVRRMHTAALASSSSLWAAVARRIAHQLGITREVHVTDTATVDTPTVIGWLRPVVLLPVAVLTQLTPAQVEAILAHELAHIRRHDFIVNLLQTVAETVLFYHPAIWWLSSRIRTEREHCCDDIAVSVCGDPVGYAEALTTIAAWSHPAAGREASAPAAPFAMAATGGSLLQRVRRLLPAVEGRERRRRMPGVVMGATVVLVLLVATRLVIVAQAPVSGGGHRPDDRIGPGSVNRILGFDLFPPRVHYVTDDPAGAPAWDVRVTYPGGEMAFLGFTGRSVIRHAYGLDAMPVVDAPAWIDTESHVIRAETSTESPQAEDFRAAIRTALEGQFAMSIRRDTRLFPIYGLQVAAPGRLGPNVKPSVSECVGNLANSRLIIGPVLHEVGQGQVPLCGVDTRLTGISGRRVTFAQLAQSLRGFGMGRVAPGAPEPEVVDQTGLTGVYDFEVDLGLLPLSVIATAHPNLGIGFGPMIRTIPQAMEEQLGLRLVASEGLREVAAVVTARRHLDAAAAQVQATVRRVAEQEAR